VAASVPKLVNVALGTLNKADTYRASAGEDEPSNLTFRTTHAVQAGQV